jgi:hypothetical protein
MRRTSTEPVTLPLTIWAAGSRFVGGPTSNPPLADTASANVRKSVVQNNGKCQPFFLKVGKCCAVKPRPAGQGFTALWIKTTSRAGLAGGNGPSRPGSGSGNQRRRPPRARSALSSHLLPPGHQAGDGGHRSQGTRNAWPWHRGAAWQRNHGDHGPKASSPATRHQWAPGKGGHEAQNPRGHCDLGGQNNSHSSNQIGSFTLLSVISNWRHWMAAKGTRVSRRR